MSERLNQTGGLPMFDTEPMESGPDEKWIADCLVVVEAMARTHPFFTATDVWSKMSTEPQEPRAMGAVFRRAKKEGWIYNTGHYVPDGSHGRPIPTWKSLVYQEAA